MTDQLTDDALYKLAESMYYTGSYTAVDYIFDALKVHRDGLRVLLGLPHPHLCEKMLGRIHCDCGRDQHIASLKELLGVSQ